MKKINLVLRKLIISLLLSTSTIIAFYLYSDSPIVASCGAGSTCERVLTSTYANILGFPITLIGCFTYITLLICTLYSGKHLLLKLIGTYLSYTIILGAVWFFAIQLFIIGEFCYYCCTIHVSAVIASVLYLIFSLPTLNSPKYSYTITTSSVLSIASFALLQILAPHQLNLTSTSNIAPLSVNTDNLLTLYDGSIKLNLDELPCYTTSKQKKTSLLLSDFTCPHCLNLTHSLLNNHKTISSGISIYFLPIYQNSNTKEINRILILLQRIDPKLFKATVTALYEQRILFDYSEIKTHIEKKLDGDFMTYYEGYYRWSEKLLTQGKNLAKLNQINAKVSGFPQFMISDKVIEGEISISSINSIADSTQAAELNTVVAQKNSTIESETSALNIFPAETHLGRIIKNKSKQNSLTLKNSSSKAIEIDKWSVSCGCIQLKEQPHIIPANSEVEVKYEFDTKKFIGDVTHRVFIYEKNIDVPHTVTISADVWMPVKILPFKTNFGNVSSGGQSKPQHTNILNNTLQPTFVTLGDYDSRIMKVTLKEIRPGQHYELISQIINSPDQNLESTINIKTSNAECSTINLPTITKHSELFTISPRVISSHKIDRTGSTRINLTCNDYSLVLKKQFKNIKYIGAQKNLVHFKLQNRPNDHTKFILKAKFDTGFNYKNAQKAQSYFEITFKDPSLKKLKIYITE